MTTRNRVQSGVPSGGQFAASIHSDVNVRLDDGFSTKDRTWGDDSRTVEIRNSDGRLCDHPDGAPAFRSFDSEGRLRTVGYFIEGVPSKSMRYYRGGAVAQIEHKNGQGLTEDPADGSAAAVSNYAEDGRLTSEIHVINGRRADLPDGTPCERLYHSDGSVRSERWSDGRWTSDNPPGTVVTHPDPRREGHFVSTECTGSGGRRVTRYTNPGNGEAGPVLDDGPGGEPAVSTVGSDGTFVSATHWNAGRRVAPAVRSASS